MSVFSDTTKKGGGIALATLVLGPPVAFFASLAYGAFREGNFIEGAGSVFFTFVFSALLARAWRKIAGYPAPFTNARSADDSASEAFSIAGGTFVFPFVFVGVCLAYFAVKNYLETGALRSTTVLAPMGAAIVMFATAARAAKGLGWFSPSVPQDAPWEVRPKWQSATFEEDLFLQTVSPQGAARFAAVGWGVGGLSLWLFQGPPRLLLLVLPIAFSMPAVFTFRRIWHRWTYGTSTISMNVMPGRLGQPLSARVQAGFDPGAMKDKEVHVALKCYRRRRRLNSSRRCIWEETTGVKRYAVSSFEAESSPDGTVEIPVSFELPAGTPPSTPQKKPSRIAWVLEVSAETDGTDYQSYFEIPVFESEEPTEPPSPRPDQVR